MAAVLLPPSPGERNDGTKRKTGSGRLSMSALQCLDVSFSASAKSTLGRFCKNTTAIGTVTQCRLCVRLQTSISVPLLRAFALALRGEPHSIVEAFCSPEINSRKRIESPLIPPRRRAEVQKRSGWQYVVRGGRSAQSTSTARRIALNFWRRGSESNRRTRICIPLTRQENQPLSEFATHFLGGAADLVTTIS